MIARLYFDEDASDTDLISAIRLRGIDVVGVADARTRGRTDEEQLSWATGHGRVLYGFNRGDFCRIHTRLMRAGQNHGGIILALQQQYSIGEQMRRLLHLLNNLTAEDMVNRIEFLSAWGKVS
jgi:hypothetical protein